MNMEPSDSRCSLWDIGLRQIRLLNNIYEISGAPERGGSCLVYKAVKKEFVGQETFEHRVVLKEFYPVSNAGIITRTDTGELQIPETSAYQKRLEKFIDSYKIMLELKKSDDSIDHSVTVNALFKANGTWYIEESYDSGILFFDYYKTNNVFPSIKYVLGSLAYCLEIVGRLHKLGYYHLDIKPENLSFTKSGVVKFFDTDSFVKISELETCTDFMQSDGFSAPELALAAERPASAPYLIGPWTDIYSIAQFICYYLFGKPLSYIELLDYLPELEKYIIFTDYYEEKEHYYFETYEDAMKLKNGDLQAHPRVVQNGVYLLKTFLNRALSPDIYDRYQCAEEALGELRRIVECFHNYKLQLEDLFQEFIPEEFTHFEKMQQLEDLLWNYRKPVINPVYRHSQKEASIDSSRLVVIKGKENELPKEFVKCYATIYREKYDSIHEIHGTDLEDALYQLRFFQHGNASIYEALKLSVQDLSYPTLLIFYDESIKTQPVNDGRILSKLLQTANRNLHILFVANPGRNMYLEEYMITDSISVIPEQSEKEWGPADKLYNRLIQYDCFFELTVFLKHFGWYIVSLLLTLAGFFLQTRSNILFSITGTICWTIAICGFYYRYLKKYGKFSVLKQNQGKYLFMVLLLWLCFFLLYWITQFSFHIFPLMISLLIWCVFFCIDNIR